MYIFVYGTLCRGLSRNKILAGCDYMGLAMGGGSLIDLKNYPAMLQGRGHVIGEVYRVESEELIPRLDEIEGYRQNDEINSLYIRRKIQVRLFATGDDITSDVYLYNRPASVHTVIAGGDYPR